MTNPVNAYNPKEDRYTERMYVIAQGECSMSQRIAHLAGRFIEAHNDSGSSIDNRRQASVQAAHRLSRLGSGIEPCHVAEFKAAVLVCINLVPKDLDHGPVVQELQRAINYSLKAA